MSDATYTYRINLLPRETVVNFEQRMGKRHGWNPDAPLDIEGATYHRLFDEADPGAPNPVGLIETADGPVFTYEDMIGWWDPKDVPLPSIEDVDAELVCRVGRPPEIDAIIKKHEATESDFFKRQLEGIDKSIYTKFYPISLTPIQREGLSTGGARIPVDEPSLWTRFKWFTYPFRAFLASWLIGRDVDAEEDSDAERY